MLCPISDRRFVPISRHAARFCYHITGELFGTHRRRRITAGRSRSRNQQWLHVCTNSHSGIRRLEVLSQFSLLDERARNNKGVLQAFSLPERDVEKSIAEIGPMAAGRSNFDRNSNQLYKQ